MLALEYVEVGVEAAAAHWTGRPFLVAEGPAAGLLLAADPAWPRTRCSAGPDANSFTFF